MDRGKIYESEKATKLPENVRDHAIQFEENKWIDTNGIGRYFNHSCSPNIAVQNVFVDVRIEIFY